jgi:TrmH family RNA methyltransferase
MLTSLNNPRIKEVVKLRKADYRRQTQNFVIEGYQECKLALSSNINFKEIYFCPRFFNKGNENDLILEARKKGAGLCEVNEGVFNKIAYGDRREGLIAVAGQPKLSLDSLKLKAHPLLVVLEHIEKPGNLGAVIRSADAAGAQAVIAADAACDIYNPNVLRSSVGAVFSLPVIKALSRELIPWLKARRIKIVSTSVEAKLSYSAVDFRGAFAIILGSEEKGLTRLWKKEADFQVSIPMAGYADSLNVSAAAAILLFEAVRQRGVK